MTRPHTTHHESCGCCEAERDALKAQVERLSFALAPFAVFADQWDRNPISGLSNNLYSIHSGDAEAVFRLSDCKAARSAIAASPAQSLAAHDAEVRAKALREAAEAVGLMHDSGFASDYAVAILALAERAPEVER